MFHLLLNSSLGVIRYYSTTCSRIHRSHLRHYIAILYSASTIACYFEAGGTPDAFRRLLLEDPQGGLPRGFIGDDLHEAMATKFSAVFEAVRDVWTERKGIDRARLPLRIHPSIEEETHADILYRPAHPSGRVFLLYTLGARAEHFWFESLGALSEALWCLYQTLDAERQWAHRALARSDAPRPVAWLRRWGSALHDAYRSLTRMRPSSR